MERRLFIQGESHRDGVAVFAAADVDHLRDPADLFEAAVRIERVDARAASAVRSDGAEAQGTCHPDGFAEIRTSDTHRLRRLAALTVRPRVLADDLVARIPLDRPEAGVPDQLEDVL